MIVVKREEDRGFLLDVRLSICQSSIVIIYSLLNFEVILVLNFITRKHYFFTSYFFFLNRFFAGPFAILALIISNACSKVIELGSVPFGMVAFIFPFVT